MKSNLRYVIGALAVGAFHFAAPALASTLKVVAHADPKILDPMWSTNYISRNHGYMIYDTLFSTDANGEVKPQMAEGYTVSPDGLVYTITLRDGLFWHDGPPVTSADVVPSLERWSKVDSFGKALRRYVKEIKAVDPRTFQIVLSEPFGSVIQALGKESSIVPFIMPERIALTPPSQQIKEYVGSGPFVLARDEWKPGEKIVYLKNEKYQPRPEPASGLAGGKVAKVDRVEWISTPDQLTAVNALIAGEVDLIEGVQPDLFPMLKDKSNIARFLWNPNGLQSVLRFNALTPPFNNADARRAVKYALNQTILLEAQHGDKSMYELCNSPMGCAKGSTGDFGTELLQPNLQEARRLLKQSGYAGEPVVVLHQTDLISSNKLAPVLKSLLERAGFKVDVQSMDSQSYFIRRNNKGPASAGGWNMFFTVSLMADVPNPLTNIFTEASCEKAFVGWTCDPELENLRKAFETAPDQAAKAKITKAIDSRIMSEAHYLPVGTYKVYGAYRKDRVSGWLEAPAAVFWNIQKNN